MDWLRYYTSTLESSKVQSLPPILFKAWVNLLCVSRIFDGVIPPNDEVCFRLRCSDRQCNDWLADLTKRRLLERNVAGELVPHQWDEHQYDSDSSTQRSRKSRELKKQQKCNVAEALPQLPRTEQNRTETEQSVATPEQNARQWCSGFYKLPITMQDLFDNLQTNHPKGTELLKASEAFTEKVNAKRIGGWNMAQIIERHTDSCRDISWQDQGGKFAPKLAVWIAGEQWNDKIPPKVNGKNPHEIDYPEL